MEPTAQRNGTLFKSRAIQQLLHTVQCSFNIFPKYSLLWRLQQKQQMLVNLAVAGLYSAFYTPLPHIKRVFASTVYDCHYPKWQPGKVRSAETDLLSYCLDHSCLGRASVHHIICCHPGYRGGNCFPETPKDLKGAKCKNWIWNFSFGSGNRTQGLMHAV